MKILVSDKLSERGVKILREAPGIEVDVKTGLKPEELKKILGEYDGLIVRSATKVTADLMESASKLKVIGRAGSGVDNIDMPAATKRGIVVMNTPGGNTVTTAEHALSLLFAMARKVPQATASIRAGKWEKGKFVGSELAGKLLGIVGLGNIGKVVADRAKGLKMEVIAFDPFLSEEQAEKMGVELATLEDLCRRADFITVHTPLSAETRGIIGKAQFAVMKKGVMVVNAARGGIIDEAALAEALRDGKVAGAALDVFEKEPPAPDHPLLAFENVIATPHLGASTEEAQENVAHAIAEQMVEFFLKGTVRNAVNMPSVSADELPLLRPYLTLGERLGSLVGQMMTSAAVEVAIEYSGECAEIPRLAPVTVLILKGLLAPHMAETVNSVNAPLIAKERGIRVVESRSAYSKDFTNLIQVSVRTARDGLKVGGAILGKREPRLVRINDFWFEAVLEGNILILHNEDVPGVVGMLGTVLGRNNVNIAALQLGREKAGGTAISLVHIDVPLGRELLDEMRRLPHIRSAVQVSL